MLTLPTKRILKRVRNRTSLRLVKTDPTSRSTETFQTFKWNRTTRIKLHRSAITGNGEIALFPMLVGIAPNEWAVLRLGVSAIVTAVLVLAG